MKIAAIILAGGEGRRIGGNKPLRLLGGRPLIDHAIAKAGQWTPQVAVVVRREAQLGDAKVRFALDEPGVEGPLAGLIAALRLGRDLHAAAVLTLPSDMPFLPYDLNDRLESAIGAAAAAIASSGGRLHPVCGLWRVRILREVPGYLLSGHRSLKGFAEAIGFSAVEWPSQPHDPFFNINSQEDLAAAERLLSG